MNIIKLKDINKQGDTFFNKHLKGKYAYWVHMRYIVSFDHMRHEGYVACEEDIDKLLIKEDGTYPKPFGAPYIDIYNSDIVPYIDIYETDKANCIVKYRMQNEYATDCNITIDELKKFRTWLATQLLRFDQDNLGNQSNIIYDNKETHVLEYYKNGMYDDVVKYLSVFGQSEVALSNIETSSCGCGNNNLSSLYNSSLSTCDALFIYRKNIYKKMVEIFSNIDFWNQFPKEFILEFKKYIDNIIKCDFKLSQSSYISDFIDCGCSNIDDQSLLQTILKRLSESLQYIAEGQLMGHKNYIADSFKEWSEKLYEIMEW